MWYWFLKTFWTRVLYRCIGFHICLLPALHVQPFLLLQGRCITQGDPGPLRTTPPAFSRRWHGLCISCGLTKACSNLVSHQQLLCPFQNLRDPLMIEGTYAIPEWILSSLIWEWRNLWMSVSAPLLWCVLHSLLQPQGSSSIGSKAQAALQLSLVGWKIVLTFQMSDLGFFPRQQLGRTQWKTFFLMFPFNVRKERCILIGVSVKAHS